MGVEDSPQCSWVSVVDGAGRRRLEMRWSQPGTVTTLSAQAGAAATRAP
jgi:hypothetical protein